MAGRYSLDVPHRSQVHREDLRFFYGCRERAARAFFADVTGSVAPCGRVKAAFSRDEGVEGVEFPLFESDFKILSQPVINPSQASRSGWGSITSNLPQVAAGGSR